MQRTLALFITSPKTGMNPPYPSLSPPLARSRIRADVMASSIHNSQPWLFALGGHDLLANERRAVVELLRARSPSPN